MSTCVFWQKCSVVVQRGCISEFGLCVCARAFTEIPSWEPSLKRYIDDPEAERDNPSLQKTLKLFRSGNNASRVSHTDIVSRSRRSMPACVRLHSACTPFFFFDTINWLWTTNLCWQATKPNKEEAAAIEVILKSPILKNTLGPLEASLLWRFRHVLCSRTYRTVGDFILFSFWCAVQTHWVRLFL